ncbi:MAG: class I SAM-dependent DNA methyltransferase [Planctomycetota bacterium]
MALPETSQASDSATAHLARLAAEAAPSGVSRRRAQGAHYTPPPMVDHLVSETLDAWRPARADWRAIDPACGSGNFLVALARELARRFGEPVERIVATRIFGVDIDAGAVALARGELLALVVGPGGRDEELERAIERNIVVADALAAPFAFSGEFDLILGNPPFLNQLERGTALARERARAIAAATGGAVTRYADVAAAVLVTNLARLAPNGRLGFVMPQSFLSTGDSRGARDAALDHAELRAIWSSTESHFEEASVRVATLVFSRARLGRAPRRAWGEGFATLADAAAPPRRGDQSWSPLLADAFGAPVVTLREGGSIGDIAHATADFRDQYYGLAGAIAERDALASDAPILVTTRHIDLARNAWGERPVRMPFVHRNGLRCIG